MQVTERTGQKLVFFLLALALLLLVFHLRPGDSVSGSALSKATHEAILIEAHQITQGFQLAVDLKVADNGRFYVAQMNGIIRIVESDGTILPDELLDISDLITPKAELGLSSIALHPQFTTNGRFFVSYDTPDLETFITEYQVTDGNPDTTKQNPKVLLQMQQPSSNHNGAGMMFGPDGYLYIGLGDGGPGNDPNNNGQNGQTLLGTILRLDIDNSGPQTAYGVPADNPFIGIPTVLDEIWAMGLRNPWRFSFDRANGDLFIGDVGQNSWEEINYEAAGTGGWNYGWRCYEGLEPFITTGCGDESLYTKPIFTMPNDANCAIVGGYVYRGDTSLPIDGHYLFGDYCSGSIWSLVKEGASWHTKGFGQLGTGGILTFSEGPDGTLYAIDFSRIFEISARSVPVTPKQMLPVIFRF